MTNSAGAYTTAPLVLGTYTVSVNLTGFKKAVATGIVLRPGDVVRHDVVLQVGDLTETIEVSGGSRLDDHPARRQPQREREVLQGPADRHRRRRPAGRVGAPDAAGLPADDPNGDPMFRGSQFNSRINGGQARATENFFDGGAFGYASGHQGSQESAPPVEAVQEVTVITTTYSAQYGHTSGGFIEYTSKSGTNKLHGSAYSYLAHDKLNSAGLLQAPQDPAGQQELRESTAGRARSSRTRRSSSSTPTGPSSAPAPWRASATRRPSTRSRPATSARS